MHWLLGHADRALQYATAAIARARADDSAHQLAVALAYGAVTHQFRGDMTERRRIVDELSELCERCSFGYYREWALVLGGWSRDDGNEAVARLEDAAEHGSAALLARCHDDLTARGVPVVPFGVPPMPGGLRYRGERLANAAFLTS